MIVHSAKKLRALISEELDIPAAHPFEHEAWKSTTMLSCQARHDLKDIADKCRQSLVCFDKALLELEEQINEAQKCLAQLKTDQAQQLSRVARLDSAISPLRKLPPEILSLIFAIEQGGRSYLISKPGQPMRAELYDMERTKNTFPEHVCSLWRQVALNTPSLYRSIHVNYAGAHITGEADVITELAGLITSRGAQSIYLYLDRLRLQECQQCFQQVVLPRKERLHEFIAVHNAPTQYILNAYVSLFTSLPYLVKFSDLFFDEGDSEESICLPYIFPTNIASECWSQMADLTIGCSSGSDAFLTVEAAHFVLQRCPQLQELRITLGPSRGDLGTPPVLTDDQVICLQHLYHLQFHVCSSSVDVSAFLKPLLLASLWRLRIYAGNKPIDARDISALIQRSNCQLEILRCEDQTLDKWLEILLPNLEHLRELAVPHTTFPPMILRRIAHADYLPQLQRFDMLIDDTQATLNGIVELAEFRWENKNGTDIVHLQFWYDDESAVPLLKPPNFEREHEPQEDSAERIIRIQSLDARSGYLFA